MGIGVLCYDLLPMLCRSFQKSESCCFFINASSGVVDRPPVHAWLVYIKIE